MSNIHTSTKGTSNFFTFIVAVVAALLATQQSLKFNPFNSSRYFKYLASLHFAEALRWRFLEDIVVDFVYVVSL